MRTCNMCKQEFPLTAEYFYRNKSFKSGFAYQCKNCRKEISKRYYEEKRKAKETKAGTQVCRKCGKTYPLTGKYFPKYGNRFGRGFRDICNECVEKTEINQEVQKKKPEKFVPKNSVEALKKYEIDIGKKYKHYKQKAGRGKEAKQVVVRNCIAVQNTERFVIVQYEDYRESVLKTDLIAGLEKLERV
ncbi:MAG TPA: hypothetical protein VFD17_00115 [Clostridia bacterium]|nr:hypothetical protein [Clostridia bacterium]